LRRKESTMERLVTSLGEVLYPAFSQARLSR